MTNAYIAHNSVGLRHQAFPRPQMLTCKYVLQKRSRLPDWENFTRCLGQGANNHIRGGLTSGRGHERMRVKDVIGKKRGRGQGTGQDRTGRDGTRAGGHGVGRGA